MERKKWFVNMQSREISGTKYGNSNCFTIYANDEEIGELRRIMDHMYDADQASFIRAHIPFVPYHNDEATATFDEKYRQALEMLYQLGNDETKAHIESTGMLRNE